MWPNIITNFNQLLASIILFLWSFLPKPAHTLLVPAIKLETATPSSITVSIPKNTTIAPAVPWGTTEKLADHQYRTYVANDPVMGTPDEILTALNNYRQKHRVGQVRSDDNLCKLALWRAQIQNKAGNLDGHKGLIDYMNDQKHWEQLNITAIGENASYGYVLSGVHLIEWVFDSDLEHRENQLHPKWNLACAGTSGVTVDIIFGQR